MILDHKQFDLYGKKIFEKIILKPPFKMYSEMPDEACFMYAEEGGYDVSSQSGNITFQPRDAVLMRCGSYFAEFLASAGFATSEVIVVHLYPDILKRIFENELSGIASTLKGKRRFVSVNKYANNELIKIYIESVRIYFDNPSLVNDELIVLKLKELIILLTKTENADTIGQLISSLFSQKEYLFREVIEAHLFTESSIEQLAALTHQSLSSFKREFTKVFDDSPAHYFKQKKLERAAELLGATNQRIGDIAFECGFNDLAHFSKSFQAKYGVSPSQFKMNQKNKSLT